MNLTQTRWAEEAPTQELRVPPAAAQWRAEQGLPPIDVSEFERTGRHCLAQARDDATPHGWPPRAPDLPELGDDGLYYDEFGVVRPRLRSKFFRRHAARHTTRATS